MGKGDAAAFRKLKGGLEGVLLYLVLSNTLIGQHWTLRPDLDWMTNALGFRTASRKSCAECLCYVFAVMCLRRWVQRSWYGGPDNAGLVRRTLGKLARSPMHTPV